MKPIIFIADPEIVSIPIVECNEPLVDLKNQSELRYGSPPENELTTNDYTLLRKTVFDKLCSAQKDLPNNWKFRVYEGYRSIKVQKMLFDFEYQKIASQHPGKERSYIFRETTRLISPIENLDGSVNIPPHNTGGAVDVEIIMPDGRLVDMGMVLKDWISVDPELCLSHCESLDRMAQQNCNILFDVMSAHEFVNYPNEWWHFSYGDRYWAYHKNQAHAIYGPVDAHREFKD